MSASAVTARLWAALGGAPEALACLEVGSEGAVYRSRYRVDDAATATIGVTAAAAAEVWTARSGTAHGASVDARHAASAFRSEQWSGLPRLRPQCRSCDRRTRCRNGLRRRRVMRLVRSRATNRDAGRRRLAAPGG